MRLTSWIERRRKAAVAVLAVCLLAAIAAVASPAAVARPGRPAHILDQLHTALPERDSGAAPPSRRAITTGIVIDLPATALCNSPRALASDDAADAIQNDAPPIGLVYACGDPPPFQPLGTLGAFHAMARGNAGVTRRSPRGPPLAAHA